MPLEQLQLLEVYLIKIKKICSDIRAEYDAFILNRSRDKTSFTIEQARKNKLKLDWANYTPKTPNFIGTKTIEVDLDVLVPYRLDTVF
jgi:5-methyltetrahydrofolate--homocysteine methyltransferase